MVKIASACRFGTPVIGWQDRRIQKGHMIAFAIAAITPMTLRMTARMLSIPPRAPGAGASTSPKIAPTLLLNSLSAHSPIF